MVSSSLRVNVGPRGDSMNRPHAMCYGVWLLLDEVWSWSGRRGRRRGDYSSGSLMVNGRVLRGQKVPWSNVVSRNGLLACGARKCLIWS